MKTSKSYLCILWWVLVFLWFGIAETSNVDLSNCYERTFIVSWYYSAKPDQSFYYRDNYSREITLNWDWIISASGREVFNWMLAAPRNYWFGTEIYLPGYWVWEVQDRWQAIVNAGQRWYPYDRLDVWMWYWEEGLKRALSFWKQTITWYVCNAGSASNIWFDMSNFRIHQDFFDVAVWSVYLSPGRNDRFVEALQSYLIELGYLEPWNNTGYYWAKTESAVCSFQVNNWITSENSLDCGYFWPKTRSELKYLAKQRNLFKDSQYRSYVHQTEQANDDDEKILMGEGEQQESSEIFEKSFSKDEESKKVWKLQEYLKDFWYYEGDITNRYDSKTINAVYSFQKDKDILWEDAEIRLKGYFGPSTRDKLNTKINSS